MKRFFVSVLVLGFIFAGCAKKATVQPEQPAAEEKAAEVKEEKKAEAVKEAPREVKEEVKEVAKKVETVPVIEVKPGVVTIENIHFDFDQYYIRDDAKPTLQGVSDWLIKNKSAKMLLEGHCDEWGTNEYNLALGERRAKSTKDYLVSSGVDKDRFNMISYGEERPLCREQTKECWQKNRRVQFVIEGTGK
ncbi:MAG: peptidoglycan-associated lipoprotein Pal [Nitrospirae bacterium]|nr:peptidoglycan-associated lipoprotein Pal [Nitrospirota bacterium]